MTKDPWKYQEMFAIIHIKGRGPCIVDMHTRRIILDDLPQYGFVPERADQLLELMNTVKAYDPEED